jgi:hypothetical protein
MRNHITTTVALALVLASCGQAPVELQPVPEAQIAYSMPILIRESWDAEPAELWVVMFEGDIERTNIDPKRAHELYASEPMFLDNAQAYLDYFRGRYRVAWISRYLW